MECVYTGDSDEANSTSAILYGQLTSSSVDVWHYSQIRNINIFLDNIDLGTIEETTKKTLKAQAYLLRAWKYFEMVRVYGGIPIIDKAQSLSDDLYVKRNKTSDCIDFILRIWKVRLQSCLGNGRIMMWVDLRKQRLWH